jgi:hypothetical protein
MSSTPEEGDDGAIEDNIDLPKEASEEGVLANGSEVDDKRGSELEDNIDDTEDAAVVGSDESEDVGNAEHAESLVNEDGTASQRRNIRDQRHSDEESISIPDDSQSIQVR